MKIANIFTATALASILALAACSPSTTDAPTTEKTAAAVAATGPTVASADFSGRSDHVVLGNASIVGAAGSYELVFDAAFDLDGAPDPVVGFGNNETYDASTMISELSQHKGAQRYKLPADFDPAKAGEVYVWCRKFNVPLGVATFHSSPKG